MKPIPVVIFLLLGLMISLAQNANRTGPNLGSSNLAAGTAPTFITADDTIWVDGEIRSIVNHRYYVATAFSHGSGTLTKQEWLMVTTPFPNQPGRSTEKREFLRMQGNPNPAISDDHLFSFINGSDLLIHALNPPMGHGGQCLLFDPKVGKDVSKPFSAWVFNRSRTACLTMEGNQVVILDTLSARTGDPKILSRPPWGAAMEQMKFQINAVLTQDAQYLVLFPYITSSSYVVASNFTCEVWSTNGSVKKWTLPIERKEGKFVDAELIEGKVMLLWRNLLPNGAEDSVELLNTQGNTLHSGKISAFTLDPLWSPERHKILFPYYEAEGSDRALPQTFYVWNYSSNTVQRIGIKR